LVPGNTYYFAATSLTAAGLESDFSTEVSYTMPANGTNVPPTLDLIGDVAINENAGLQTVALTGISSGSPSEVQTLTVNAFSSNPFLVPNPSVVYTSPNPTGSLTFTPAANSYGNVTMTVMVDDGGVVSNTVIRTFNVTVAAVNAPPTLDPISDLSINENDGLQSVPLTGIGTGAPNEIQTLTVTAASSNPALISTPTVYYTSPSATGRVSFTPVANAYGVATITVTVNDGQPTNNLTSRSFNVSVNQTTNGPQPQAWTIWWQNSAGKMAGWSMLGTNRVSGSVLSPSDVGTSWKIGAVGDLDGDGQEDLIRKHDRQVGGLAHERKCGRARHVFESASGRSELAGGGHGGHGWRRAARFDFPTHGRIRCYLADERHERGRAYLHLAGKNGS
jgi:hypothetical protein